MIADLCVDATCLLVAPVGIPVLLRELFQDDLVYRVLETLTRSQFLKTIQATVVLD